MTNEERKDMYMNRNIKIYPFYLALTWDLLFVWTIMNMFFTQVKGLTYSQSVLLTSIQMVAACLMCLFVTKKMQKTPEVKATRIGNMSYIFCVLIMIFAPENSSWTFWVLAIAEVFLAHAYIVASVKHLSILNNSLAKVERSKDFDRVYGKGLSTYYILEAAGAIAATYIYSWNPYAVFWASLIVVIIAQIVSVFLKEPSKFPNKNVELESQTSFKERQNKKPDGFLKILSSGFVIVLLLYAFLARGLLSADTTVFRLFLQQQTEAGAIPLWLFGYIFAAMRLGIALTSKYQFKFNLKFGIRSLIIFMVTFVMLFVSSALVNIFMPAGVTKIVILCVLIGLTCMIRSPNIIFLNNYMQVCTHPKNFEQMYALRTIAEYGGYAIFNTIYAQLLAAFPGDNWAYANLVYIGIALIPLIVILTLFIRALTKKFTQKYTIIKPEYTEDE